MPLPLLIALQFLTRLPISLPGMPEPQQVGRSLLWYPVVGLLVGLVLLVLRHLLGETAPVLQAAVLLAVWVAISGGLHLDGLADTADAWVGGFGDRERTLEIMKDPRSGPIAITVLVLVMLLKFTALVVLIESDTWAGLLLAPWIGRALLPALLLSTPYVRAGGLGQALSAHMPHQRVRQVLLLNGLCMLALGWSACLALLAAALVFFCVRRSLLQRLGGTTGDTAGALLELAECAVVLALALAV